MKASMKDVAKHANVSTSTVSHVINNTRFVAEETRKKVLESIELLGYVPDQTARSFKTGQKKLIGIVVPDISNPIWSIIIEEVEAALAEKGYNLLIVNTKETQAREITNLKTLSAGLVDGIIIASTQTDYSAVMGCVPQNFPMVFIDRLLDGCASDSIILQDYSAFYDGVKNMILDGHKKIGCITGLMRLSTNANRLRAYRDALTDFGIEIDENLIEHGNSLSLSAIPLIQNLLRKECTAIAVSNNIMLDDVLSYLRSKELYPSRRLELLGQTVEGKSDYDTKGIQVLIQPSKEIGRLAGRQILSRIEAPDAPVVNTILQSRLIDNRV